MKYIAHRINTSDELKKVPAEYGIEVDLRDRADRLICQHEPFSDGEDFELLLQHYKHGTIILNIKSEGIEYKVLELLQKYKIRNYFFLDSSFPMIFKLIKLNEKNIALRFSEFEKIETILSLKDKIKWVWIDCFTKLPIDSTNFNILKEANFKLCLVSPDLVCRSEQIVEYKDYLEKQGIQCDAVCTKMYNIKTWQNI